MENPQELRIRFQLQVQLFTILLERSGFLPMGNGDGTSHRFFLAGDAAWLPLYYILGLTLGGNGEWRRMRCTCCQGCGPWTMLIHQWGLGSLAMEPMERTTEPGKIYSKLWPGVVAIIKLRPPFKLWLKFHAIWKGLSFILLLVITLSSTQIDTPSLIP